MIRANIIPKTEHTRITCSEGDTSLRKWAFELYADKERWTIDADSVSMQCSNGVEIPGTIEDNTAVFDCTAELSATAGNYRCKLKFTKGTEVLFSQEIGLWVEGVSNGYY